MKNILKVAGLLFVGISMLNAAECSSEKKAQMIMNGVDQATIDNLCSAKPDNTAQQPVQIIINNSSSADNTNTNTNTVDAASGYKNYSKTDSIRRDRMYIAINAISGSGEYELAGSNYDTLYTEEITGQTLSFSLGYVFNTNNRFEIASSSMAITEHDYIAIDGVDLNWIWTMGTKEVQSGNMRPYLLLGIGVYTVTNTDYDNSFDAIGANLGLGVMYPLGDMFEIDLGYHVKSVSWDLTNRYEEVVATESLTIAGLNLSLRLKF